MDGEKALKSRQALVEVKEQMKEQNVDYNKLKLHLRCELPNVKMYHFEGKLTIDLPQIGTKSANIQQFLQRGSTLSNTDWAIGLVVYSGRDTKLMKNLGKHKYKQSHIEKSLNRVVIIIVIVQFIA